MNECRNCGHPRDCHADGFEHCDRREYCMECECERYAAPKPIEYTKGPEEDDIKF